MQAVPDAGRGPVAQPPPAGHPAATAHLLGQVLPGDAGLQHKQDPRQRRPVRHARPASLRFGGLRREQRRDVIPQFIRDKQLRHA
jgi:hypothetical protein